MKLSDNSTRVLLANITVDRAARQRQTLFDSEGQFVSKDGLLDSVLRHGVLSPILIDHSGKLIFGERRLTASILAGLPDIPARYVEDLTSSEYEQLELIENLARSELEWRDEVRAVARLHEINLAEATAVGTTWGMEATAAQIGSSQSFLSRQLRVWKDFDNPKIALATSMQQAFNTLDRYDERREADALGDLVDATSDLFDRPNAGTPGGINGAGTPGNLPIGAGNAGGMGDGAHGPEDPSPPSGTVPPIPPAEPILHASFLQWAPQYSGRPFNMLHCDFPYGANLFGGAWGGKNTWENYSDQPDDYLVLIRALCENLDRVMAPSAHLMFWCSANVRIQHETIAMFRQLAPSLIFNEFPLVWHKTDNMGIVPDHTREARRVTETCLYAAREDRKLVRTVSNAYGSPTNKDLHPSTKPEPMLKHFMQMFVDDNTTLLDPTCGSGTALRAAETLGAKQVLGLEKSEEYFQSARTAMKNFRALRKATR